MAFLYFYLSRFFLLTPRRAAAAGWTVIRDRRGTDFLLFHSAPQSFTWGWLITRWIVMQNEFLCQETETDSRGRERGWQITIGRQPETISRRWHIFPLQLKKKKLLTWATCHVPQNIYIYLLLSMIHWICNAVDKWQEFRSRSES